MPTMRDAALAYRGRGLHPFPCRPQDKTPLVKWEPYQREPPELDEIEAWWERWPNANIALAMGRGLMAVDLDGPEAEQLLLEQGIFLPDEAPRVSTGKGWHVYLSVPGVVPNSAKLLERNGSAVDIRGDGGYVIAPPSTHPSGRAYTWQREGTWPPPMASDRLLALVIDAEREQAKAEPESNGRKPDGWISAALQGVAAGRRNQTCAELAGYFLRHLPSDIARSVLLGYAGRCRPPMSEREVIACIESVRKKAGEFCPDDESDAPLVQHISTALDSMRAEMAAGDAQFAKTPFPGLNKYLIGGFGPGELVYVGARPAVGKTALALEFARGVAKNGKRVLFISREMPVSALARRMVAQEGSVRAGDLKLGRIAEAVINRVAAMLSPLPIWLSDAVVSVLDLHAAIEAMPEPVDYLIVDYLQLVRAPREIREKRMQVEHVSQALKDIAMRRKIPVVCLSSLSRPPSGQNTRPNLASLRESGELEHDASVVLLLHVPDEKSPIRECIIAKGREGRSGVVELRFDAEFVRFAELETNYADEEERDAAAAY